MLWRIRRILVFSIAVLSMGELVLGQTPQQNPHGEIKTRCASCHTAAGWAPLRQDLAFDHAETGFLLEGGHLDRSCVSCHQSLVFADIGGACADCHTDAHKGELGQDCESCHVSQSWDNRILMLERHQNTLFPLLAAHARTDCESCHVNQQRNEFKATPIDCVGCHLDDFIRTVDPNHALAGFDRDCEQCHQAIDSDWSNAVFAHPASFMLIGGHSGLDCASCHAETFAGTPVDCIACHEADFVNAPDPDHVAAGFPTDCTQCHNIMDWTPAMFDHGQTGFPLTGGHAISDCRACHENGFSGTPTDCIACHEADFNGVADPNHVTNNFPSDCTVCHTTAAWEPTTFDHNQTQFALTGVHAPLDCIACHEAGFAGTPTDCIACHEADFNGVTDPNHVTNNFPSDCTVCHTTAAWEPTTFDHNQTQFALTGAHAPLDCIACHEAGFAGTPTDCIACHEADFNGVADPNHVTNNFPSDCTVCHTTAAWEPTTFDHNQTQFALTGAHAPLDCIACHEAGFAGTPTDCIACHESDFNGVSDPNHVTNNFPADCTVCHTTAAWEPTTFDHNQTQFALTGAHVPLDCIACHEAGFAGTPTDCIACHESDFNGVSDPNHVTNNFPSDCTVCHTTAAWEPTIFDHNQTQFALTGAHAPLDCIACHEAGFAGTPTDCIACHESDFNGVSDPNHVTNNFPTDCTVCHTTAAWEPTTFDHNQTQFALTGAHAPLDCIACHEAGFAGTPTDCIACHESDFNGVSDPNHVTNNFPSDCTVCHTTAGWEPTTFDHNQTQFALTGAHAPLDCIACHEAGFAGTPTDCIACHESDFNGVSDPNHVTNNFPSDCTVCHTTAAWEPTTFDHNQTQFALTGAHAPLDCIACHEAGFAGTPTDCIACHESDFNGVSDPNHVTNNFPSDCTVCHTTAAWEPTTFDHNQTQFALTGAHAPLDCIACHEAGFAGTPTDCIACHESDFNGVSDPNHVTNNFPSDCTVCHTTAAWEPTTFDHNQTQFALTGAHAPLDCVACHEAGFAGTPTDCIACHESDFNGVSDPNHVTNSFPSDCTVCHTTAAWEPTTFDHNQTQFALTGAHAPLDCVACHEAGFAGTPTDCIACHESDYNGAEPNHAAAGFPTDCLVCHTTVAWSPSSFDHDGLYFPIFSGRHRDEWNTCSDCHLGGNFQTFECIFCHEHNQPDTDDEHDEVPGYIYQSQACFSCHPDGRE